MSKPSILFINRVYPPVRGATGQMLFDLAQAFVREGWSVTILSTGRTNEQTGDNGVIIRRIKCPEGKNLWAYFMAWVKLFIVAQLMARRDLVITLSDPPMIYLTGRFFARLKSAKHIHWCHDLYPDLFPALGFYMPNFCLTFLKKISRRTFKKCAGVVAIGGCMAEHLAQTGMDINRLHVIPNWADRDVVSTPTKINIPIKTDVQGAKPSDKLIRDQSPKFRVLYAGTIGRAHPMQAILDAAEILSVHAEIEFVFAGDSPAHDRLAKQRDAKGLSNIKFIPHQPAALLRQMMEGADIHIVTQKPETAGLLVPCKTYSALAVARPCIFIGPENTEIGHMILTTGAGQVIAPTQGDVLANIILEYRLKPELWEQSHLAAMAANNTYSPAASFAAWIKLAQKIMGRA